MHDVLRPEREVAVIGWSCRLPGARSVPDLWALLSEARCAVSQIPRDRWLHERLWHPRKSEPGRSYTWAAGVLDDIWGFDPAVFGISPREAEQMDPQQRLLLELVWEALEDAGLPPSSLAGKEVGVFVGASALDYGNTQIFDMAATNAQTATGNTLSLVSNRLSYVFDLRGPSFTVDTACSSSLVALNQAMAALRSGRIDTAIVAGVNVLASPFGFVLFSRASMLSPTGLCQAFDAKADGYVRGEGGVVLVLRNMSRTDQKNAIHGTIIGSGVNSDGRTVGVSMPSSTAQAALLEQVYRDTAIDPEWLAFIEAHGTGTAVGDPAEANAIGKVLGQRRGTPLPIGSIKTNIGHLEPASGLAGVLKAMLALKHSMLPASLHFDQPNPNINFDALNVSVSSAPISLARTGTRQYAGVNSFGFGGTNAHVIVSGPPNRKPQSPQETHPQPLLVLSAESRPALVALSEQYAERLDNAADAEFAPIIAAAAHRRERLANRLAVPAQSRQQVVQSLRAFASNPTEAADVFSGTAANREVPCGFIYSGNGSQWGGMGRSAYQTNPLFRERFDEADILFTKLAGWSLKEALFADDIEQRLHRTSIAQPLIFAIQYATTQVLDSLGLRPAVVLGHSVGEIAAANAAGILDLEDAVRVIHFRSLHQELGAGKGRMAVVFGTQAVAERLCEQIEGLEIAAFNSSKAFTLSGTLEALETLAKVTTEENIGFHALDLDYAFHSSGMDAIQKPLVRDLQELAPRAAAVPFVSTVLGDALQGAGLDASYWWRNIREPVLFRAGVQKAAELGARIFVEIGPRHTLLSHINDNLQSGSEFYSVLGVLDRKEQTGDPFRRAVANAFVRGAAVNIRTAAGSDPGPQVELPGYAWQRTQYRLTPTSEAITFLNPELAHPLLGARLSADGMEWRAVIDRALMPGMSDHCVNGQVLFPGAAFLEMALAAARIWHDSPTAAITDVDVLAPLAFADDTVREIMTRVSPVSGSVEIFSRPRLSGSSWQIHATAKMVRHAEPVSPPALGAPRKQQRTQADELYKLASTVGLQYGESYRQVDEVRRLGPSRLVVELTPPAPNLGYGLDPARLDACFHGLVVLFAEATPASQRVMYIPVRFGEVRLLKPGVAPARAVIEVEQCKARSILANFYLLDDCGEVVALLRGARFQGVRNRATRDLVTQAYVQHTRPVAGILDTASQPVFSVADVLDQVDMLALVKSSDASTPKDFILMEGWATAAAVALAQAVAGDNPSINVDTLIATGRLPNEARLWFLNLLYALETSGLAVSENGSWRLEQDHALPEPGSVLLTLAAEHPERSAEMLLGSFFTAAAARIAEQGANALAAPVPPWILDSFELGSTSVRQASELLMQVIASGTRGPHKGPIRILQVGYGPLSHFLLPFVRAREARLTILEFDRRRLERAKLAFETESFVEFWRAGQELPVGGFDLIVSAFALHRIPSSGLAALADATAVGGIFVAVEPTPSFFRDVTCGLTPSWFGDDSVADFPVGRLQGPEGWRSALNRAGFIDSTAQLVSAASDDAVLLVAQGHAASTAIEQAPRKSVAVVHGKAVTDVEIASRLSTLFASSGHQVCIEQEANFGKAVAPQGPFDHVIYLSDGAERSGTPADLLRDRCLRLKSLVDRLGGARTTLWIVMDGVLSDRASKAGSVETGLWNFSRTMANEITTVDVRRISTAPGLSAEVAAAQLKSLVLSGTPETELLLNGGPVRAVRVDRLSHLDERSGGAPAPAAQLQRAASGSVERLSWNDIDRVPPGKNDVEIAVEATGLNFRDVMLALSLIPEDLLEDGFAGPTLGLECAGRVLRVGAQVRHLKAGDRVVAFSPSAFSTHVTIPATYATQIPGHISFEAAATIPVAFSTAYYALVTLAKLRHGEWVLVHGGAGGVGLAALQIARARGARIIATAGSEGKRALLKALGADHILDSRSLAFIDDIRRITGDGVDVVLNSLSGEAMEQGLKVLKAFGRFVELGKRDYVANTHVGLRPFRQNISYFAADLDQLLVRKRVVGLKLFRELMRQFDRRILSPLPYRTYSAAELVDAFRLMQQSGHIGKIIIKPPSHGEVRRHLTDRFVVDAKRTHLVTGAFGGFGLQTARWLADHGAHHLVLVGRNGATSSDAVEQVAELKRRGVHVMEASCDVADRAALSRLFKSMETQMPPLAGVIHGAMVLDDGIIANLDAGQLDRVLRPKVLGAEHLHELTRERELDYFVLFSSATTFLGNPGQGSYVAANGYMEGLARRRRQEGLPALAIAWGAIGDAGVLVANREVAEALASKMGVKLMKSQEALDLMADALTRTKNRQVDEAVLAIVPIDWSTAQGRLSLLNSPTFESLGRGREAEADKINRIDLAALVAAQGVEAARTMAADIIAEEVSRVLRIPKDDLQVFRPLSDAGLDSLMAIELAATLQDRLGLQGTATGSPTGLTIIQLAEEIVGSVGGAGQNADLTSARAVMQRQLTDDLTSEELSSVSAVIQKKTQELLQ